MLFTDTTFVGIDTTSSRKTFTYAALDRDLNLIALADGEMEEVMTFLAAQKSATVAINAPAGVNRGLVRAKIKKEMLAKQKQPAERQHRGGNDYAPHGKIPTALAKNIKRYQVEGYCHNRERTFPEIR